MKKIMVIILLATMMGCAKKHEVSAPCTYDNRVGCGELIYSHEIV